jgi:hypothetical protein
VFSTLMGLMETPVVAGPDLIFFSERLLISAMISAVAAAPLGNSTPAYKSSVFSRTSTRSMS